MSQFRDTLPELTTLSNFFFFQNAIIIENRNNKGGFS
jgi:hypothetical protein